MHLHHHHQQQHQQQQLKPGAFGNVQYSPQELQEIKQKLNMQLGPEFIANRSGPGSSRVSYLEGGNCIEIANHVFGFNGWSSSVVDITVDYCIENGQSIDIGLSATVRVTLRDGSFREDIGYGTMANSRQRGAAFQKCKKEAITDGIKRCFRSFGNATGGCLYDKDFLASNFAFGKKNAVKKVFDESNLLRPWHLPCNSNIMPTKDQKTHQAPPHPAAAANTSAVFTSADDFENFSFIDEDMLYQVSGTADRVSMTPPVKSHANVSLNNQQMPVKPTAAINQQIQAASNTSVGQPLSNFNAPRNPYMPQYAQSDYQKMPSNSTSNNAAKPIVNVQVKVEPTPIGRQILQQTNNNFANIQQQLPTSNSMDKYKFTPPMGNAVGTAQQQQRPPPQIVPKYERIGPNTSKSPHRAPVQNLVSSMASYHPTNNYRPPYAPVNNASNNMKRQESGNAIQDDKRLRST